MFDIPSDNEPCVASQRTQQCTVTMKQQRFQPSRFQFWPETSRFWLPSPGNIFHTFSIIISRFFTWSAPHTFAIIAFNLGEISRFFRLQRLDSLKQWTMAPHLVYRASPEIFHWLLNNNSNNSWTPFNNMLLYVCLRMVSFRVKVWVTYIVFLSNGIFCFKSRGPLKQNESP